MAYYSARTYLLDTKEWIDTDFETRNDVVEYIDNQFKYPSEYNLKYSQGYWNEQGMLWQKTGSYPVYVPKSIDYRTHWKNEARKCKFEGFVIYKSIKENLEYAVPGLFYWYLNYCPIVNKVKQGLFLPDLYDGDYHYFLYILRCILHRKYGCVLKKRQAGYTLKNMAIILNAVWFTKAAVTKVFASDITKVEESWAFMEYYRDHMNKYTGWKRGLSPNKILNWKLRRQTNDGAWMGKMSSVKGFTTQQNPTNGVGGSAKVIFGEESGINSTLDVTHEYITSNVAMGGLTTGLIIYSGAVGELDKAEPLKEFILKPIENSFLSCNNNIEEDSEFGSQVGFFAPEWWNYIAQDENGNIVACYDEWGNTDKDKALLHIKKARKEQEQKKAQSYRYYCSQRPLSIKEAFAFRKDAYFPQDIVVNQMNRHEIKPPSLKEVILYEDQDGKIAWRSRKAEEFEAPSIVKFPLSEKDDKRGCIVIKEFPESNPERFTYFAGVDDIMTGKSTTSESLFTVVIFKNIKEVKYKDGDVIKTRVEGNEPVAWYTGRTGDLRETHLIGEYLIRYYNAFAAIENNVQGFIQHMQSRGLQYLMATKNDVPFIADLHANKSVHRDYGIYIASNGTVKDYLLANAKAYITEELDKVRKKETGEVVKTVYGIERISDLGLLREFQQFHKDLNVDRLIAFMLAQSMAKAYQVNGIIKRENQVKEEEPDTKPTAQRSFFKNLDSSLNTFKVQKSYFKQHG